jgi:hypothetical protein
MTPLGSHIYSIFAAKGMMVQWGNGAAKGMMIQGGKWFRQEHNS